MLLEGFIFLSAQTITMVLAGSGLVPMQDCFVILLRTKAEPLDIGPSVKPTVQLPQRALARGISFLMPVGFLHGFFEQLERGEK